MTGQINVAITEAEFQNLESFVESAINDKEEYLENWARNDGYTEEDLRNSDQSIKEVKAFMAGLKSAFEAVRPAAGKGC